MVEWASALSFVGFGSVIFLETFLEGDDSFLATFIMALVWPITLPWLIARAIRRKKLTGTFFMEDK